MYLGDESYNSLNRVTNKIGHFIVLFSDTEYSCTGVIRVENDMIILQCEMPTKQANTLLNHQFRIVGKVNSIPLTLYNSYVKHIDDSYGNDDNDSSVEISFFYLIIGCSEKEKFNVYNISSLNSDINWFFPNHPVNLNNKEGYIKKLDSIKTQDKNGTVSIQQSISEGMSIKNVHINIYTVLSYDFDNPVDLELAINRIACLRNMLSFFCDGYIPLINMKISDKKTEQKHVGHVECDVICNYSEKNCKERTLFFINAESIKKDFGQVWKKWTNLYEKARPITSLFYGVISDSSSGLNAFLNLSQALEVYSVRYRNIDIRRELCKTKKDKIHLSERLYDLIELHNTELSVLNTVDLAKKLSDIRNYYTHYNNKLSRTEPTHIEVLAASYILRSILILVIYSELGITSDSISEARKMGFLCHLAHYLNILNNRPL